MEVKLFDVANQEFVLARIEKANLNEMPLKKNGWRFNWKKLYKVEGAEIYKLTLHNSPTEIEGLIMLSLMYGEMLYLNNIEISPHNFGENGKFDNSAGCLIAFACQQSFKRGVGEYTGYLSFESKTKLIPLYQKKYGAVLAMGQRMFIEPEIGTTLIQKYLESYGKGE